MHKFWKLLNTAFQRCMTLMGTDQNWGRKLILNVKMSFSPKKKLQRFSKEVQFSKCNNSAKKWDIFKKSCCFEILIISAFQQCMTLDGLIWNWVQFWCLNQRGCQFFMIIYFLPGRTLPNFTVKSEIMDTWKWFHQNLHKILEKMSPYWAL